MKIVEISKSREYQAARDQAYRTSDLPEADNIIAKLDLVHSWNIWSPFLSPVESDLIQQYLKGASIEQLYTKYGVSLGKKNPKNHIRHALRKLESIYNYIISSGQQSDYGVDYALRHAKQHLYDLQVLYKYRNVQLPW